MVEGGFVKDAIIPVNACPENEDSDLGHTKLVRTRVLILDLCDALAEHGEQGEMIS